MVESRVRNRAGGLRRHLGRTAGVPRERLEGIRRVDAAFEERRQFRPGNDGHLFDRGGCDDLHIDALRAGHRQRRDTGDIDLESSGGQRLDHVGAGLEGNEPHIEPRILQPAFVLGDEDLRRAEDRDEPDADGHRLRGGSASQTERQEERGEKSEHEQDRDVRESVA